MEDKKNEILMVTVYADDTGLFSEEEYNYDNTTDLDVPRWVVEAWYKKHEKEFKEQAVDELNIPEEEVTFDKWFKEVYTCDDFIGFYDFCIIKGIVPRISGGDVFCKVTYEDDNDDAHIVYEGTYNECRRWCKYHEWKWMWDYDLYVV